MTRIAISAAVMCTDGKCGKCTNVIINPVTNTVTHIVVHDKGLPRNHTRLVPTSQVASASETQITLKCARADVENMTPFIEERFIQESAGGQGYATGDAFIYPYVFNDTAYDTVKERNVPVGEFALQPGMHVATKDGKVGKLDELVLDPDSGEITHLLMREGHLWGKKDVAVPISAFDVCDADTIYLKMDKAEIQALPTVAVKRR